jgi:hypothetical protein
MRYKYMEKSLIKDTSLEKAKTLIVYGEDYRKLVTNLNVKMKYDQNLPIILIYKYTDSELTMVGEFHSHDPENGMNKEIRKAALDYMTRVPRERRLFIVEGFGDMPPFGAETFEKSVAKGGAGMGIAFLANSSNSKVISPEFSSQEMIRILLEKGFSKEEVSLHEFLKEAIMMMRRNDVIDIESKSNYIVNRAKLLGSISKEWRDIANEQDAALKIAQKMNEISEKQTGKKLFTIESRTIRSNIQDEDFRRFQSSYWGTFKALDVFRDEKLLTAIYNSIEKGMEPFVVYGSGHVLSLKPALDYLYGESTIT